MCGTRLDSAAAPIHAPTSPAASEEEQNVVIAIRDSMSDISEEHIGRELRVRIGITTGEALVALRARPSEGEGMAAGDVVNTASRLQSNAPVNGILVDESTYRATRHAITYGDAEPVRAKGKADAILVWQALEPRARLGVDVADRGDAPLVGRAGESDAAGDRRGEAFAAWRRFLEALAERSPLVLVFEDLHWADDGLLDFVDHLVDWAGDVPLLVVCTARPELLERRPGWGGGKPDAATVSLRPLSDAQTAGLIAKLLDRPVLAAEAQTALLAHAGGNPLYAEQYARMLEER